MRVMAAMDPFPLNRLFFHSSLSPSPSESFLP